MGHSIEKEDRGLAKLSAMSRRKGGQVIAQQKGRQNHCSQKMERMVKSLVVGKWRVGYVIGSWKTEGAA